MLCPGNRRHSPPAVFVKDVAVTGGLEMQIVRFEPGARLPLHEHECPERIYVLEG